MDRADALTDAWAEHDGDPEAAEVAKLLVLLEDEVLTRYISIVDHFTKNTEYDSVLVSRGSPRRTIGKGHPHVVMPQCLQR